MLSEGQNTVGSHIVFCMKCDGNESVIKYKACIITKGFSQAYGQDFMEIFSSIAKFTILQTLLSIVACKDWKLHQVDVVTAYLHRDLDKEIYMTMLKGVIIKSKTDCYLKLKKPLYGLKQAGQQWKTKLDEAMLKAGFEKSQADNCLYILKRDGEIIMLVLVYIDNMANCLPSLKYLT